MSLKEKLKAVALAIGSIEKQYGKGAIMKLGERTAEQVPAIPSGAPSLDRALGCGGYPRGRIIEVFGPESSGKTTLTLHAIAEAQRAGGVAAFIDAEHALDVNYARALGVDVDQLLVSQPDTGEQALDILEALVRSGAVDLVVVDSVAALVPKAEIEGDMGDQHMGLQARLMSQALRKLTGVTHRSDTTIIFIKESGSALNSAPPLKKRASHPFPMSRDVAAFRFALRLRSHSRGFRSRRTINSPSLLASALTKTPLSCTASGS
jgi:recombination protein RecA